MTFAIGLVQDFSGSAMGFRDGMELDHEDVAGSPGQLLVGSKCNSHSRLIFMIHVLQQIIPRGLSGRQSIAWSGDVLISMHGTCTIHTTTSHILLPSAVAERATRKRNRSPSDTKQSRFTYRFGSPFETEESVMMSE